MDISNSTEAMVSAMKAFNISANESIRYIDLLTISDSNLSVTANDVAEGMKRASAALAASNNTAEQSVALFNSVFAVLQNAESSATVLRTVSQRLRNTAGQLEELGEDATGAAESITKLQTQLLNLTSGRLDIMLNQDTFKSTYDIIDELSQIWGSLTDIQQAEITSLVAGIRNAQGFSALVNTFDDARKSMELFETSSGDAMDKFDKMSDSIAFKSERLSAEFQKMAVSVVNSGIPKTITDVTSGFLRMLNVADSLPAKIIAITTALVGLKVLINSSIGAKFSGAFTGLLKPKYTLASIFRDHWDTYHTLGNGCLRPVNYQPMSKSVSKKANMLGSIELNVV